MTLTLYAASFSPWSEKARWALAVSGVAFQESDFTPLLSEAGLRLATRNFSRPISVPTLTGAGEPITDSLRIARWADRNRNVLFPEPHEEAIEEWNYRCDAALAAGRILATRRVAGSEPARRESLPRPLRGALYPFFAPLTDLGIAHITRKYGFGDATAEAAEQTLRRTFDAGRQAIAAGHPVGERFTFADIALACSLHFVSPHPSLRMGAATRAAFTQPALADEYADLLAWRERCYERHRTP